MGNGGGKTNTVVKVGGGGGGGRDKIGLFRNGIRTLHLGSREGQSGGEGGKD